MDTTWEGSIAGVFEGYAGGRVHTLSDGTQWLQADRINDYVYRERPKARLLKDRGTGLTYLDVEGTSTVVRVTRHAGPGGLASWGF